MSKMAEKAMQKRSLKLTLEVSKEKFISDDNREINYYAYTIVLNGEEFRLQPKKEDKRYLNSLVNNLFDNENVDSETGEVKIDEL